MDKEDFPSNVNSSLYDGCAIMCNNDEILVVDPRGSSGNGSWNCVKKTEGLQLVCPGEFNTSNFHYYINNFYCYKVVL